MGVVISRWCYGRCQSCHKKKAKCSCEQRYPHCARMVLKLKTTDIECQYDESRSCPGAKAGVIKNLSQRLDSLEKMFLGQALAARQLPSAIKELNPALAGGVEVLSEGLGAEVEGGLRGEINGLKHNLLNAERNGSNGNTNTDTTPTNLTSTSQTNNATAPATAPNPPSPIPVGSDLPPPDLMNSLSASLLNDAWRMVRERYLRVSRQTVILASMEEFSVENLQALVIIAFDTICSVRGPKSRAIVDSMTRTVGHLQLSFGDEEEGGRLGNGRRGGQRLIHRMAFLGPPKSWTEGEERRRVFWNVFLLDRFCSVATGRRLPGEGAFWESETPVKTRYFGISDPTPPGSRHHHRDPFPPAPPTNSTTPSEEEALSGFAYCIEATESLSQVTRFLLQHIEDLRVSGELDLRLREASVVNDRMDPNSALAHTTHNTSVVSLHQGIAYRSSGWRNSAIKLPSETLANTRLFAAAETTNNNTGISPTGTIAVLLAHATFYATPLRAEFITALQYK
ncbi:hypothetical protein L873DRAFT_1827594 [Choiromyces venosus 120613-1]|uniref:Xylanolytic transcriptional activator regulatory domain-containing protein n=1 Tax=Choiromyces venosus 120613-1 TaxID=1336337 RepID=A0A3N4JUK7_9PEZI|nr:hypothetical protein L873DRAFT_1827594 [Choiromyces venosus 120613-1]